MAEIAMPQLGETMTEGTVEAWCKAVGDAVELDDLLCEISSDKVTVEVPSPVAGRLAAILVAAGETVSVGTVLARIEATGDAPGDALAAAPPESLAPAGGAGAEGAAEPVPPRPSPLARRLARQNGIDPAGLAGSGAQGRVRAADVRAALPTDRGSAAPPSAATSRDQGATSAPIGFGEPLADGSRLAFDRPSGAGAAARGSSAEEPRETVVPFTPMRRRIAEHMVRSVRTAAHGYISVEVDYGAVDRARRALTAREEGRITYLPFVLHAVSAAMRAYPLVNALVRDDHLIVRRSHDIGIAVDLDTAGLVVPVVRGAERLDVRALAHEVARLSRRARENRLSPDEMSDGSFTVTNPGVFGTRVGVPIIHHPQAAILVTDGVGRRPCVVQLADGTEALAIRPVGNVGLSMDHRAFDGAYAAAFLADLKRRIEAPAETD